MNLKTKDTVQQFSHLSLILHWLVGVGIIALLAVGVYMQENEVYSLYPIHKSIGAILLLFILARIFWRIYNGWPQAVADSSYRTIEHNLAKTILWVLIIGSLAMPLSGMLMSIAGGHGLYVFGFEVIANNPNPELPNKDLALNASVAKIAHQMHFIIGYIMIGAVLLHILGAFKHHRIDKDSTLKRMLGMKSKNKS